MAIPYLPKESNNIPEMGGTKILGESCLFVIFHSLWFVCVFFAKKNICKRFKREEVN